MKFTNMVHSRLSTFATNWAETSTCMTV